jgi:DNA-binding NarL/FixJ family response regulator
MHRARVQLVETNADTCDRLAMALHSEPGLEVTGAAASCTGRCGLLATEVPDVVVVDLNLPDGEGIDLIGEIRQHAPRAEIMVFGNERSVVSAMEGPDVARRILECLKLPARAPPLGEVPL